MPAKDPTFKKKAILKFERVTKIIIKIFRVLPNHTDSGTLTEVNGEVPLDRNSLLLPLHHRRPQAIPVST